MSFINYLFSMILKGIYLVSSRDNNIYYLFLYYLCAFILTLSAITLLFFRRLLVESFIMGTEWTQILNTFKYYVPMDFFYNYLFLILFSLFLGGILNIYLTEKYEFVKRCASLCLFFSLFVHVVFFLFFIRVYPADEFISYVYASWSLGLKACICICLAFTKNLVSLFFLIFSSPVCWFLIPVLDHALTVLLIAPSMIVLSDSMIMSNSWEGLVHICLDNNICFLQLFVAFSFFFRMLSLLMLGIAWFYFNTYYKKIFFSLSFFFRCIDVVVGMYILRRWYTTIDVDIYTDIHLFFFLCAFIHCVIPLFRTFFAWIFFSHTRFANWFFYFFLLLLYMCALSLLIDTYSYTMSLLPLLNVGFFIYFILAITFWLIFVHAFRGINPVIMFLLFNSDWLLDYLLF